MKCQGAVLRGIGHDWEIQEITLDPPQEGEVLVKMAVAGVCHSDDHYSTGDGVFSPGLAAMVEATGGTVPEFFASRRAGDPRRSESGHNLATRWSSSAPVDQRVNIVPLLLINFIQSSKTLKGLR